MIGEVYETTITGYGSSGEGVGRLSDGRVIFVRNSAQGDVLSVRVTKAQKRFAFGEIVDIMSPSGHRIKLDCPHYPLCGGCDFRHISYEHELEVKLKRVNDALERISGISIKADEILSTGKPDGYRNKAVLHSDGKNWGFYSAGSHDIVPIEICKLLRDEINHAIANLSPDNTKRKIEVRSARDGLTPPFVEELDGLTFEVSGFFQVNTEAAILLLNKAREYAAMNKNETLLDLYCGVGVFTIFVGRDAQKALGVEINADAIKSAKKNARYNALPNIEFISADAAKWDTDISPDCIIIDPPRSGLSKGVTSKIIKLSPKRIVYVSCDPATMARDIKALDGFSVTQVCAVDMFPRTANVESCCLLVKS
ncbi:MAG: class I SAM-dependent RNA methyltransferase [Oscillospiraceae bacterium]|nr:class I SAM-dependent RNA methyltransferase [Oscillospiraceae bacterium]